MTNQRLIAPPAETILSVLQDHEWDDEREVVKSA
jgi:hypothetical protein